MKFIIAAGGTGGHIIPALAIALELRKQGHEILYIGNIHSMEERIASANGIPFRAIDVQKLYRKLTLVHVKFPVKLIRSVLTSYRWMKAYKPDAFIGTGGFVSGPVGLAALIARVPIFWQEQNSYPGITTRFIARFARKVFIAYQGALKFIPRDKCLMTGNPIHPTILSERSTIDFENYGISRDRKKLLILGGSQGSTKINRIIFEMVDMLIERGWSIIWQCGKFDYESLSTRLGTRKEIYLFAFTDEMGKIYNSSDLAVSRAGALTLAELEAKSIPAILVPLPTAAANHQYFNALEQQEKQIAVVVEQQNLTADELMKSIISLHDKLDDLRSHFGMGENEAAYVIARTICTTLSDSGK